MRGARWPVKRQFGTRETRGNVRRRGRNASLVIGRRGGKGQQGHRSSFLTLAIFKQPLCASAYVHA